MIFCLLLVFVAPLAKNFSPFWLVLFTFEGYTLVCCESVKNELPTQESHVHPTGSDAVMPSGTGAWGGVLPTQEPSSNHDLKLRHPSEYDPRVVSKS
ncbi:hypothetical protein AVEN_202313-1 [Araneus ventricosus]|uniref:Secreted protein n=1 Tax=Araneus ventricosus TaxID=182803 RepID=A0A4Y2E599_ARAVE|nr:hypothetical protein AVEN_202313-1 [Araneus ventricosus]